MAQSSIEDRPKNFGEMIGQKKILKRLKGLWKSGKFPQALLFSGPKGSGKTTIAHIIAQCLQTPKEKFGFPVKAVRLHVDEYPIFELNCGRVRKVEEVETFTDRASYVLVGKGKRKVFIFDEAHNLSRKAMDVLLKLFEDKGSRCTFIICSTEPEQISDTLRSRCQIFAMHPFTRDDLEEFIKRKMEKEKSPLSVDDLVDALVENSVTSGRLVANACDQYLGGTSAEEAAQVEGVATVSSIALIRALGKGEWNDVRIALKKSAPSDVRLLRIATLKYLRTILLDAAEINEKNKGIAEAIKRLAYVSHAEHSVQFVAFAAELFTLCDIFSENSL